MSLLLKLTLMSDRVLTMHKIRIAILLLEIRRMLGYLIDGLEFVDEDVAYKLKSNFRMSFVDENSKIDDNLGRMKEWLKTEERKKAEFAQHLGQYGDFCEIREEHLKSSREAPS